jgi:sulfate transport system substrate-binding protein
MQRPTRRRRSSWCARAIRKGIKDWDDLIKPGLQVIVPNPKTSGNGRYTYLAAWGYALDKTGNEAGARDFVSKLFANVPVLDGGGRGATTTFTQRDIGDVLVTFENEAILIAQEVGSRQVRRGLPVAVHRSRRAGGCGGKVAGQARHPKVARAYLDFLYTRRKARKSSPSMISVRVIRRC